MPRNPRILSENRSYGTAAGFACFVERRFMKIYFQQPPHNKKRTEKFCPRCSSAPTDGIINKKSTTSVILFFVFGGERGIRTPGPVKINGFQDRRIRPLCHLSSDKSRTLFWIDQIFFKKIFKKISPAAPKCSLSAKKVLKNFVI